VPSRTGLRLIDCVVFVISILATSSLPD